MKNKKAFTLVELIVVVTILIILSTISFYSVKTYVKKSRDAVRINDLAKIELALEVEVADGAKLIMPEDNINITASGEIVSYQGYMSEDIMHRIGIDEGGRDPLDETLYTYSINKNKDKFQLMGFIEDFIKESYVGNTYALDLDLGNRKPIIKGYELGIFLDPLTKVPSQKKGSNIEIIDLNTEYLVYVNNVIDGGYISGTGNVIKPFLSYVYEPNKSCINIYKTGEDDVNGIYKINPTGNLEQDFFCDMGIISKIISGELPINTDCYTILSSGYSTGDGTYYIINPTGSGEVEKTCNMTLINDYISVNGNPNKTCNTKLLSSQSYGSGIYIINPTGDEAINVFCDMTTDGGGWTKIEYATDLLHERHFTGGNLVRWLNNDFETVLDINQINSIRASSTEGKQSYVGTCNGVLHNYFQSSNNYDYSFGFKLGDGTLVPQVGDKNLISYINVPIDGCKANDNGILHNTVFDFTTKSVPILNVQSRDPGDNGELFGADLISNPAWLR